MERLADWIAEQIRQAGPVPFATFMEWALYHPENGYYTSDRRKIGKEGDFYTSPSVNPVFAEVLADDLTERLRQMALAAPTVIEFGAGEGRLARDMLARWQEQAPDFFERLTYRIVETSPHLREMQQEMLRPYAGKVAWQTEAELQAGGLYEGAVITNELVDAYPVHRVKRLPVGFAEIYVAWDAEGQQFAERTGPLTDPRIEAYLGRYGKQVVNGQTVEVGLPGLDWYERTLSLLARGYVLTIDYGFDAQMLYHPSRPNGTLRGFYRHHLTDDPYQHVGEQDLTADVNFTALLETGEAHGLKTEFYGSQTKFLLQANILQRLTEAMTLADPFRDPDMKRNRAIRQMIVPGGLGDQFKVLLQSKGTAVL